MSLLALYTRSFLSKGSDNFDESTLNETLKLIDKDFIHRFPDGTLQLHGEKNKAIFESSQFVRSIREEAFQWTCRQFPTRRGGTPVFSHWGMTLFPYMKHHIEIWVWENSPKLFRDAKGRIVFAPCVTTLEENKCPLDNTTIHVFFKRQISAKQRSQFACVIKNWLSSEMNQTLEKPKVILNDNRIVFFPNVARFSLDLTNADQNVITYLMLQMIHYSHNCQLSEVDFTQYHQTKRTFTSPLTCVAYQDHFNLDKPIEAIPVYLCPCPMDAHSLENDKSEGLTDAK